MIQIEWIRYDAQTLIIVSIATTSYNPVVEEVDEEEEYNSKECEVTHDLAVCGRLFVHLLDSSKTTSK